MKILGIVLICLGLTQIGFSIFFLILSKKKILIEINKETVKENKPLVSIQAHFVVDKIDFSKFVNHTNLYINGLNKTVKSINKSSSIVTAISGIITLISGIIPVSFIN
jgi:hypothetical protein